MYMAWDNFGRIRDKDELGEKMSLNTIHALTSNGYALVLADMLGTGSSTGCT